MSHLEWSDRIYKKIILIIVITLLSSCNFRDELQKGDIQIINATTSVADTKVWQESDDNSERIQLIDKVLDESEELKNTMELYRLFLNGEISIEDEGEWLNASTLGVPKGEPEKRSPVSYSFFDINGDGSPELILSFSRKYLYLSVKDEELFVWRYTFSSFPLYITERKEHIIKAWAGLIGAEETYDCFLLDYSGNELFNLRFSRYDCNQDGAFDERDEYTFDGVEVNREQWMQLTRKYLYTDDEGKEQIKDKIEWKVLFKAID